MGFAKLVTEVTIGRACIVLGIAVSRLTRTAGTGISCWSQGRPPVRPPATTGRWLDWRRRYKARSAWYHQRTRLARDTGIGLISSELRGAVLSVSYHYVQVGHRWTARFIAAALIFRC